MKLIIKFISLMLLSFCTLFANSNINDDLVLTQVLKEFNIENNDKNKEFVKKIALSINEVDKNNFKKVIDDKIDHVSMIRNELDMINAPQTLLYLAIAESRLSNKVTSNMKASGIWQFMPRTAKVFGLTINQYVDERRDPYASTDAAFRYLGDLNNTFDKWYLSFMAYNCGQGCIKKAIRLTKSDDLHKLVSSSSLPKETKKYIQTIIKFAIMAKDEQTSEILNLSKANIKLSKISVQPGTKLSEVAKSIDITSDTMEKYNPHIKLGIAPKLNENYYFYIPVDKVELYVQNYVKPNLNMLALNNKSKSEVIDFNKHSIKNTKTAMSSGSKIKYVVKNGDTLLGISNKFNVKMKDLVAKNNISSHKILVGDVIVIP